jgi:hypothetical protein
MEYFVDRPNQSKQAQEHQLVSKDQSFPWGMALGQKG